MRTALHVVVVMATVVVIGMPGLPVDSGLSARSLLLEE